MSWQPLDLSAEEFSRPTEPPATCGIIYRSKRHAISGPPEAAKTLTALICGLEHMRAGNGGFALIDFEAGEHATRLMLEDLGATPKEIASVYYVCPEGPPDEADIEAIVAAGITFVVIDAAAGAYDVSGLDDNARKDAEKFARMWVQPLWKRHIATALIDHVVKNAETRGKYAIGSERKLGSVDVHLGLHAIKQLHRGADGLIAVSTHKDRPGHLARPRAAELELRSDPDTNRITWTFRAAEQKKDAANTTDFRPTHLMEKASRYLENLTEPVSRSQIAREVGGKREWLLVALDHLHQEGCTTETPGARGATLVSSLKPYRRETDPFPVPDQFPPVPGNGTTTSSQFPVSIDGNGNGSTDPQQTVIPTRNHP